MTRYVPYMVAMVVVLGTGMAVGVRANRWRDNLVLAEAASKLATVPLVVGDWKGTAGELSPRIIKESEVSGYLLRQYRHERTGAVVQVFLGCGRPGPVSVHSPEVCYAGGGYQPIGTSRRVSVTPPLESPAAAMLATDFANPPSEPPGFVRIFWSMSVAGEWDVPESPRMAFATAPVLFKLYVTRRLGSSSEPLEHDPCHDFIRLFLPVLDQALFTDPRAPGNTGAPHGR